MSKKWKFCEVSIEDILPTEVNANEMTAEDYNQLVSNIKKSGGLSTALTCYRQKSDGKYRLVGGNHRWKACVDLAIKTAPVVYADEDDLTRDEIIALQTSLNSLHGEDNKGILRRLMAEIKSVEFKEFAHINMDELGKIESESVSIVPISEHYCVSFILYKSDIDLLDDLLGQINESMGKSEFIVLAEKEKNEPMLLELLSRVSKKYDVKSSNTTLSIILSKAKEKLDEDENINHNEQE